MRLAESRDVLIISADSRQIYRGFDIGTAKPSASDQDLVPHRGIDVVDPGERYSAVRWVEQVRGWMAEASAMGRVAVIVGGTGFYLRALTEPLFESPELDPVRRAALERVFPSISTEALRRWCTHLDPDRAHLGRTQLIRSIETAVLTGQRLSVLHTTRARAPVVRGSYLVVDPGARLGPRLEQRFDAMMRKGWADEVSVLSRTIDADAPAWKASGYVAVREMVEGKVSRESARERVIIETRQYAKRQRTWFRHQLNSGTVTRVDPDDPSIDTILSDWWAGRRPNA
jgi:tRNA dimethylallyltransferase